MKCKLLYGSFDVVGTVAVCVVARNISSLPHHYFYWALFKMSR